MTGAVNRAVVIGASIAGLLAAQALSEAYTEVLVVDRDELPYGPVPRNGVPQTRNSHGLLAGGREAIESLLPGITAALISRGAGTGDVQRGMHFYVGQRRLAAGDSGMTALAVSRPLLEWTIRERVAATAGIVFHDRTSVLDLTFSQDLERVTGVVLAPLDEPRRRRVVEAALVVDASGRTARTPEWLERRGYSAPEEEKVRCDLAYVTRRFRRKPDDADGALAVLQSSARGVPRGGVLIAQENDEWTCSLSAYHGVRPPTELHDYVAFARTLATPAVAEVLETLEPVSDPLTYRFQASVRHHYERLDRFPQGLLVTGDALCAFDPTFGQGMSVAALEALALRDLLWERVGRGDADLARRFFRVASGYVDTPWQIAVGGMPPAPGDTTRPPLAKRMVDGYVRSLLEAATDDPVLAAAFFRVSHMVEPAQSLMRPRYAARVLAASLRPHQGSPRGLGHGVTHRPASSTAGVQVLNTASFPDTAGPLGTFKP